MASTLRVDNVTHTSGSGGFQVWTAQRRVVQRVTRWFRGGLWNPGNNYREIPGSHLSITPLYNETYLVYTYMCPLGHRGAAHSISHWVLYANGQEVHRHNRTVDHQESGAILRWEMRSWGAGRTSSIGYYTRQYSDGNHSVHFNGRRYIDGSDSSRSVPSFVMIEEIFPAYYTVGT